jgi:hypothetical protein
MGVDGSDELSIFQFKRAVERQDSSDQAVMDRFLSVILGE